MNDSAKCLQGVKQVKQMPAKKTTRASWVELKWKILFERLETSRLRKAKAAAKQGSVVDVQFQEGQITAQVKNIGYGGDAYQVRLPMVCWGSPYAHQVATWLSYRPDWLASMLAGVWSEDFVEFVESAGLQLFPNEEAANRIEETATCTCMGFESPCKHVLATIYHLIGDMERDPLQAMEQVGIGVESLLEQVHADSINGVVSTGIGQEMLETSATKSTLFPLSTWPEEELAWFGEEDPIETRWHRIIPELDERKTTIAQQTYKTWR